MKTGDQVEIGCDGRIVPGRVLMASPNGRSLILTFETILDNHVAMMPVLQQDDGGYVALVTGSPITLKAIP